MKKVLYINGNPQKEALSFSRRVGKHYLEQLRKTDHNINVEVINVYEEEIPLIDEDVLEAWGSLRSGTNFNDLSEIQQSKVGRMAGVLEKFKAADEYIFVTPLWNFGISPMLKAYIDNILIAGETFKYTEVGPVGLLGGKKATLIQASGGVYSSGPAAGMEHGSNHLKTVLGLMGIVDVSTILLEGVAMPDKSEDEKLSGFYKQVDNLLEPELV